ncbi:WhiB family transcriptional regulator [Streptomyces lydicus]|uniref:WhiB family transcriptional regulator n=1 Tax=Streptomyces lydicus TaxID=47763 RepID=UPI001F504D64|nr:WhiB family transcriptional regulator [Streptomyces lydicus]MCZ1006377.1 WhiB family transcriptional regulator [Streptomyces lydicus]
MDDQRRLRQQSNGDAGDWRHQGVCREEEEPDLFFPVGNTGPALLQIEEAKAVCRRCPVMPQCQDWALTTRMPDGVWGGMSEAERATVLRHRARNAAKTRKAASA